MVVHALGVGKAAVRFPPGPTSMVNIEVKCSFCKKAFLRPSGRFNEAEKFGWNQYCSKRCRNQARVTGIKKICANPNCNKTVFRFLNQFKKSKSGYVFCSTSCAAIVNNLPRRKIKICPICGKEFFRLQKYCSRTCYANFLRSKPKVIKISKTQIITKIQKFYKKNGRIPFKMEFPHYNAARDRFGSWNKAIKVAGFKPNPVMFARKYVAKDGHICDSFAEKIIDDWLYSHKIEHQRNIPYPNSSYTADFGIKEKFVEFFGLNGELEEYNKNMRMKEKLAKKHKLKLIKIYPKDLFTVNRLSKIIRIKDG